MIKGVGTDIVEVERIAKAIKRTSSFLNKAFTDKEIEYLQSKNNIQSIAGNFAAKEAVSKALGTGFRGFGLKDIEILRDSLGKPYVILSDNVKRILNLNEYTIHISISHTNKDAIAFAILEGVM